MLEHVLLWTINGLWILSNIPETLVTGACVSSCSGITPGNYQSCVTCLGYVSCAAGEILYNMPCPTGTEWDDSTKLCVYETGVCTLEPETTTQESSTTVQTSTEPETTTQDSTTTVQTSTELESTTQDITTTIETSTEPESTTQDSTTTVQTNTVPESTTQDKSTTVQPSTVQPEYISTAQTEETVQITTTQEYSSSNDVPTSTLPHISTSVKYSSSTEEVQTGTSSKPFSVTSTNATVLDTPSDSITPCSAIPIWLGIKYTYNPGLMQVTYSCEEGYVFNAKETDTKQSICDTSTGNWQPVVEGCIPESASSLDSEFREPVEAKHAVKVGIVAILFIVGETLLITLMDCSQCCKVIGGRKSDTDTESKMSEKGQRNRLMSVTSVASEQSGDATTDTVCKDNINLMSW